MLKDKVAVVYGAGRIDVCMNLISHGDVHGTPLIDMDVEDFVRPIDSMVRSTFRNVAVLAASDQEARMVTASTLNISGGAVLD